MIPGTAHQHGFQHLANHLYASRYYTYLFSEAICYDIFTQFSTSESLMGEDVVMRYRKEILEKGASKDGADMVASFLGRNYDIEAFKTRYE